MFPICAKGAHYSKNIRDHPYFQIEMEVVSNYLCYGDDIYMYVVVASNCRNLVFLYDIYWATVFKFPALLFFLSILDCRRTK